jgi:CHAD domain-containing protein
VTRDRSTTVAEVLRAALSADVERLTRGDRALRRELDPAGVHRARVGTRRVRSDLRVFEGFLDRSCAAELREELGWLGTELGRVRDLDVLTEELRTRVTGLTPADASAGPKLLDRLRVQRDASVAALASALRTDRYRTLLERLSVVASAPPVTDDADEAARDAIASLMRDPWRRLERAVSAAGPHPSDGVLHRVRIRAKRVRYAAEALAPAGGKSLARVARRSTDVQRILGEHQDAVMAASWLRDQAAGATPSVAFSAGVLAAQEEARRTRTRERWPKTWKALRGATANAWDR